MDSYVKLERNLILPCGRMSYAQLLHRCDLVPFLPVSSRNPDVPPGAELLLEVKLLGATDAPDMELLPPVERIAVASLKRERGNVHFQRGDYAFAINSYSIALQITESNSKGGISNEEPRKFKWI